jgi:hypothetical protein
MLVCDKDRRDNRGCGDAYYRSYCRANMARLRHGKMAFRQTKWVPNVKILQPKR